MSRIFDTNGEPVEREAKEANVSHDSGDKGEYRHYMLKETYEQPTAIRNSLEGRLVRWYARYQYLWRRC